VVHSCNRGILFRGGAVKKPNFFIIGQSKSGTSALYFSLRQHPDIYMSKVKEPCHFCRDIIKESDAFHQRKAFFDYREEKKYLKLFAAAKNEKIVGEATTIYIASEVAADEIWKFNPEARIVVLLRDPVSFVFSLHNENYRKSQENIGDLATAIQLEKERRRGKHVPPNCFCPRMLFYSERVQYKKQVLRFLDRFGDSNMKVIIYEDFKEDNEKVFKDILKFLGVDSSFVPEIEKRNVSGVPRSGKLNTMIMSSPIKRKIQTILPDSLYSLFKPIGRKLLWEEEPPEPIDDSLRRELMIQYKPEVIATSELLGINLVTKWGYNGID